MLAFAATATAAAARAAGDGARATFGRLEVRPNVTNAIPSGVDAWLDARAATDEEVQRLVEAVATAARSHSASHGVDVEVAAESVTPHVRFDGGLAQRLATVVARATAASDPGVPAPIVPTAAGHDAGILAAAGVPAAMLFVRNPTGVSHSPAEHAEVADCLAGVAALTAVIEDLACR
jgi:N-carbamoyl-L-amino-acid hydrolase